MEIKEAVEQIRKIARVENGEISIGQGLGKEINEFTHHIIVAILNGYTLCKVDEAVGKIENAKFDSTEKFYYAFNDGLSTAIEILKEA